MREIELPRHLAETNACGLVQGQPIAQFEIGDMRNFVYLLLDWNNKVAAIVDPQYDLSAPLQALKAHGFELTRILLTHTHGDHTAGVPELVETLPQIEISVHAADLSRLTKQVQSSPGIRPASDGDTIAIGSMQVQVMHTPGHSAGECCYFLSETSPPYLLTGDTLFIRDCGRTDLPTGSTHEMFESLQKIRVLPPATVILPGHHYQPETASTLSRELRESPPLRASSVSELEALP